MVCANCGSRILQITDDPTFEPEWWYHYYSLLRVCSPWKIFGEDNVATPVEEVSA